MTRDELIAALTKEAGHDEVEGGFAHSLIRAAIAELRKRDWQPIASAPKDGTHVLVTDGTYVVQARWTEGFWYELNHDPTDAWGHVLDAPTHWQPLPAPPEVTP